MEAMDVDMHDSPSWEHWAEVWQAWLQVFHHYKSLWHSDHVVDLGFVEKLATKSGKVQTGDLLNTLCALIWEYGPAGTIASAFTFKPLLKQVVAQLSHNCVCVEDSGARYGITAALLLLCEAYPAVKAITLKHCLKFGVDFSTTGNKSAARSFWLGDVEMAKAGYRAIVLSNQTLSYPWNWRSYFKLLKNESKQARWFSINAACMILKQSRETRLGLIEMEFNGQERLQYYLEWRQEQQLLSAVSSDLLYSDRFDCGPINSLKSSIFFPKLDSLSSSQEVGEKNSYVSTQSLDTTYNFMLASLERNMHVILFGASGCGKTALMNHLKFHNGGQSNTLTVHMHKSMDSRSLIGTYVCTSQAGEFQWKEGPLTIAALQGKWLCIEEINAAPQEALALLASVGETNQINVPGKGMLQVKAGFTMFGLCTLESRSDENVVHCLHHLQKSNWAYHSLTMPSVEESIQIVHMLYPSLNCVSGNLIAMYTFLTKIAKQGWQKDSVMKELVESASLTPSEVISNLRCPFNLRHLLQFCNRLVVCHEEWINASAEVAPEMLRKVAFYHAFDLFCGGVRNDEFANKFSSIFLQFWNLSTYHKDEFNIYKPVLNITKSSVSIGRSTLVKSVVDMNDGSGGLPFVATTHSLRLLEKTALAIQTQEAILLVGETGIGKTACIQHLSKITGTDLLVLNMNQQSDSSDLVGSFRPVESHILLIPLMATFQSLVARTWPAGNNLDFFRRLYSYVHKKKWLKLLNGFKLALQKLAKSASLIDLETSHCLSVFLVKDSSPSQPKRARIETDAQLSKDLQKGWRNFVDELLKVEGQLFTELKSEGGSKAHFSFSFIEGILVKAMKEGKWLLIDEINLAPSEALEKLFAVLDSSVGTFSLTERGDTETIERHPGFRLFAAMNPGTDAGKKELTSNLRGRFTEFYVEENLCREDLEHIISSSFKNVSIGNAPTLLLVDFYIFAKEQSRENLYDCAGQKPHYSLRTLCRALEYIIKAVHIYGMNKSIKDAVSMGFFTQLDSKSRIILEQHLHSKLSGFADEYHERPVTSSDSFVQFESFLLSKGPLEIKTEEDAAFSKYIVTKSVKQRLKDLSRAIYFHKSPILLQGPTSAGKTSLIKYIASATGYKCIRINNHANTDVQEYTGTYSTDKHGNIRFHEGPLVQALRMGHWVILDELNLAPSDVLEALNRLLDDNRELYVPEINETIKPHKNFLLFATQNPAGAYGGRKTLSRAFRNRFIEIYVDDIPENELPVILEKSCLIAASQAKRMVQSSKTLRQFRQKSAVFAGKHGFITPRDLLRWGNRSQNSTLQEMAESGYSLLAERLRDNSEKAIVKEILQKEFRSSLAMEDLYQHHIQALMQKGTNMQKSENVGISMGASMQRLFALIYKCWENREPVLLVGETGCGKTTACQMLAQLEEKTLHIYNCHQHSETSDFIGSYRPSRNTQAATEKFLVVAREVVSRKGLERYFRDKDLVHRICKPDCSQMDLSKGISDLEDAVKEFAKTDKEESNRLLAQLEIMKQCQIEMKIPFEWVDGPLVNAMKNGEFLLVDELSLAEDAVLERLNSVLEVGGTITLSEKGSDEVEEIVPKEGFFLLATMNPGGDFGKRELSPALRNRFTEIWVPPIESLDEICLIIKERLSSDEIDESVIDKMLRVWQFLFDNAVESLEGQKKQFLSIRDLVAWADFISLKSGDLGVNAAFGHGAYLVFQDGFGVGTGIDFQVQNLKARSEELIAKLSEMDSESSLTIPPTDVITDTEDVWGMKPFLVPKGRCKEVSKFKYDFTSCTVRKNLWRILRAMQMQRAILLEGSPGVGKSSMVQNLSYLTSNKLVRINLSEHTDMMDLLGAESPCDPKSNDGALFKWQDGPLLLAIKSGSWVLLDELNLAQQSVLEGLNALLDHRAEIFIPELNETFKCPSTFKVFATQNPMYEGGGRKGLPKSFLNRFTKVYIERLTSDDFHHILKSLYEDFPENILRSILSFNEKVNKAVDAREIGHFGGPWDFNFRDVTRCIDITYAIMQNGDSSEEILPLLALNSRYAESKGVIRHKNFQEIISRAIETVYMKRMRSLDDKKYLKGVFQEIFGVDYFGGLSLPSLKITDSTFSIGHARMKFNITSEHQILRQSSLDMLNGCYDSLESAMHSVSNGWMCSFVGDWKTENISIPSFLAEISGYELTVIKLSNCTDTSDLLGSFEQQNFEGKILSLSSELQIVLKETCLPFLQGKENETISTLFQWMQDISNFAASASEVTKGNLLGHINSFLRRLHQMKELLPQEVLEGEKGKNLVTTIDRIFESINEITRNLNKNQFSGFNWIDGPLVEAIKFGKWILLEDCNLCNPAVLDRLNPLLEGSNSYFMLNESTGNMDKLTPHKDFRLFLSWNPSAGGEISRAMRNRGIEIFLSKQDAHREIIYRVAAKATSDFAFDAELISNMLIIFAENGLRTSSLSKALLARILGLMTSNAGQFKESDTKRKSVTVKNFLSALQYNCSAKSDWREKIEFAVQYAMALDPSMHDVEIQLDDTKSGALLDILKCFHGRLYKYFADALLEPGFLTLDSDSISMLPVFTEENGLSLIAKDEFKFALDFFLYSARSTDDIVLRRDYILFFLRHGVSGGRSDTSFLQLFICFLETEVPNAIARQIFKVWQDFSVESFSMGVQSLLSNTVVENVHTKLGSFFEQCLSLDDFLLQKVMRESMQSVQFVGDAEKSSVLIHSVAMLQSELSGDLEEFSDVKPVFKHMFPLFLSIHEFEKHVFENIHELWGNIFRNAFVQFQKQRHQIFNWMLVERIDDIQDFDFFIFLLVGLQDCLHNLEKCSNGDPVYTGHLEKVFASFYVVVHSLGFGKHIEYDIPLIYKAGQPLCIADAESLQTVNGLRTLGSKLTLEYSKMNYCLAEKSSISHIKFHRDILKGHALTTLASYGGDEVNMKSATQVLHILSKEYERIEKSSGADLSENVLSIHEDVSNILMLDIDAIGKNFTVSSEGHQSRGLVLSWKPYQELKGNVQTLADLTSFASELHVLPHLAWLCNKENQSMDAFEEIQRDLQMMVDFGIEKSSRCPLDFAPHQQILWLLDSGLPVSDQVLFCSQIHELSYKWFESFLNSYDNFLYLAGEEEGTLISKSYGDLYDVLKFGHSYITLRLMSCRVPCILQNVYVESLRRSNDILQRKLRDTMHSDDCERSHQVAILRQLFLCYEDSFNLSIPENRENFLTITSGKEVEAALIAMNNLSSSSSNKKFKAISEWILKQFSSLDYTCVSSVRKGEHTGKVWLALGLLRVYLAIPPNGYDPALKPAHEARKLGEESKGVGMVSGIIDQRFLSQRGQSLPVNPIQSSLLERFTHVCAETEKLRREAPIRFDSSSYQDIIQDVSEFVEHKLDMDKIFSLLDNLESNTMALDGLSVIGESALMWATNMRSKYASYSDILQPLNLGLYQFAYGISSLKTAMNEKKDGWRSLCNDLLSVPREAPLTVVNTLDTFFETSEFGDGHLQMIKLLKSCLCELAGRLHSCRFSNELWRTTNALLGQYSHMWDVAKQKEDRELEEALALFKPSTKGVKTSWEEIQRVTIDEEGNFEQESLMDGEIKENIKDKMEKDFAYDIMISHWKATQSFKSDIYHLLDVDEIQFLERTDTRRLEEILECYDTLSNILQSKDSCLKNSSIGSINAHLLRIGAKEQSILKSYSILEMKEPVHNLYIRVSKIREEWPENELLIQLQEIAENLLLLPSDVPLKKAMSGVELLLLRSLTWEENAASHVSIKKELDSLAVVANSWRKQEMNSLKDLFTENSKKHIKSAAVGWLHLFEIMKHFTSTKSCKLKMSEILTSVEEFVQSSSMGQFETRLAILRMFYMHLLIHDVLHKPTQKRHLMLKALAAMLQNLHSYYSQVLSPVKEQNLNGTNELSKELADFIRLAKWEDINVYAMRNNIEKANRTVVKLRQKHDAILGNGIKAFFDSQANKIGFSGLASVKEKKAKHIFSLLSEYLQFKYVSHFQTTRLENVTIPQSVTGPISPELKRCLAQGQRDLYRRKLPNLVAKSSKLLRPLFVNKHLSGYWLNVAESIDDSAFQIAHRATQLRALDKPAKMQKQKALSDLFKMLKNLGLSNARKIISLKGSFLKYFKTPSSVSISMVCNNILDKALSENAREIFTKSERYFFQSLSAYQELSMLAGDYHEDIQGSEFESMVAYLQSLLDACFQLRSLLESSSRGNSVICALLETMKAFSGHINDFDALESKPGNNQDVRTWLWDIHAACQFTSELLQDSKLLLKGSKNPSNFDVHIPGVEIMIEQSEKCTQGIEELLLPKSCKVETMSEIVQLYSKNSKKKMVWKDIWPIMHSKGAVSVGRDVIESLWKVHKDLLSLVKVVRDDGLYSLDSIPASLESLLSPLSSLESATTKITKDKDYSAFLNSYDHAVKKATADILIWVEQLSLHRSQSDISVIDALEPDLDSIQSAFATVKLGILNDQADVKCLQQTEENLVRLFHLLSKDKFRSDEDLNFIMHEFLGIRELCDSACLTHQHLSIQILALLKAVTKLSYTCSSVFIGICREGYCVPPESEDGPKDDNGALESEGVGIGEGEGAKDVSDQIENEEQVEGLKGEDPEEPGAQAEENTKGVEMGDDFEGNMFDIEDDEEEDANDENEDGSDDEEELDQQMGDLDETFDAVDERLWNDEDEKSTNKDRDEDGAPVGGQTEEMMNTEEGEEEKKEDAKQEPNEDANKQEEKREGDGPEEDDVIKEMDEKDHGLQVEEAPKEEDTKEEDNGGDDTDEAGENAKEVEEDKDKEGEEDAKGDPAEVDEKMATEEDKDNDGDDGEGLDQDGQMDLDQEENEEIEQDIEDREGDDKTTGFDDIKEEPNEEAEEEEKEDDPLDIDYQQEDKETEGANTDVDEGPTGRPNPQDLTQTDMTASSGANANASVQQDEPMGEGGNETEIPMSVNDQKGMGDANQNTTEKEKLESKKQKQNQSINPHRKFGEAMEKWKLDVSVSMDLQEADKTADDLDDIQDEYAYDTGNENTEGGPEALGQAHENNENDDAPLGNEKKEAEEADADKAEDDHHENVTLKESHDAIQQKQENSAKPEDKSVKEKCEEDEEMADAEEEAEGPGEGDVKLKYDTQIHVSNTNFGLGEERDQYNAVENRVAKLDIQETNEGRMRWYESSSSVASLVGELTEQLRLTLTPTQISKMAGDFRTGKRLNIRKLIPYIASNFKKDKIWLRRTQPDKRKYQILLAVDDSRSMIENNCEKFALDSIALMCNSMTRLEVGDLGILSFGGSAGVTELHALGKPFDNSSGVSISSSLTFKQESTVQQQPVLRLLEDGLHIFQKSRQSLNMFDKPDGLHQLFLIVADGRINEGDVIKSMIQDALAEGGLMIVFIILDTSKNSLIDVKTVDFVDGMPVLKRYMDSFPFPYYILLREIHSLPRTLADLIRQWVEVTLTQG